MPLARAPRLNRALRFPLMGPVVPPGPARAGIDVPRGRLWDVALLRMFFDSVFFVFCPLFSFLVHSGKGPDGSDNRANPSHSIGATAEIPPIIATSPRDVSLDSELARGPLARGLAVCQSKYFFSAALAYVWNRVRGDAFVYIFKMD